MQVQLALHMYRVKSRTGYLSGDQHRAMAYVSRVIISNATRVISHSGMRLIPWADLERYYILGSFILGFGVPLVPAILGHFGVDNAYGACYFTERESARTRPLFLRHEPSDGS